MLKTHSHASASTRTHARATRARAQDDTRIFTVRLVWTYVSAAKRIFTSCQSACPDAQTGVSSRRLLFG
eukprot:4574291-Pleurochrysis_carterae.AAC.1